MEWKDDEVELKSPTIQECEDVMKKLIEEEQTEREWSISLWSSSPEHALIIINNLNNCAVCELHVEKTPLDSMCASKLSEVLTSSKATRSIHFMYCKITGDIKCIFDALVTNTTVDELWLSGTTGITDEDITCLSNMLSINKTLEILHLSNCNITDNGVRYICEALTENKTLTVLDISCNDQVTSGSTSTIAELINVNKSLTVLRLDNTSLNDDDIKTICTSLVNNTTIQELYISDQHEEFCKTLDNYQVIEDRLMFWS